MYFINHIKYFKSFEQKDAELKSILLDCERQKKPVTFYTRSRTFIDAYRAFDVENKPFTLKKFTLNGGIIYTQSNPYMWSTLSIDDIVKIEY